MDKYLLLRLLDDADVRKKILQLIEERKIFSEPPVPVEKNFSAPLSLTENFSRSDEVLRLKENLRSLDAEKASALKRATAAETSLTQARQRATKFQRDAETWKQYYEDAKSQAETYRRQLTDAQKKISQLESAVDELTAQLQQNFSRGQELFQKYQRVGSHARQILGTGVFVHDDFTSFICGGAQTDSLEKIWNVMSECVSSGRQQDVDILWEIFEYCLTLVNASKSGAGFSVLPVNVGDRFDSDIHREGADSRAQGRIVKIYLRGFRNDYNGRVVEKSIVQVG